MQRINKLIDTYTDIAKEFDIIKNRDLDINTISAYSNKSVYWLCPLGHSYQMPVYKRTGKDKCNCPYCSNKRLLIGYNDLKSKFPDLIIEWDYSKNDKRPEEFVYGSSVKVYWKCKDCGHSWQTAIKYRTFNSSKCPMCTNKENGVKKHLSSLEKSGCITDELLIKEWDYNSNIGNPSDYTKGSPSKVFWICSKCNYRYKSSISNRKNGRGCPACANKIVVKGINDFLTTHPNIATEWDYEKNDIKPDQEIGRAHV